MAESHRPQARLISRERRTLSDEAFVDVKIWRVPTAMRGSDHDFKYALALVVSGVCVLRYDNEAGKGDHRHLDGEEYRYDFVSIDRLVTDFMKDVRAWLKR